MTVRCSVVAVALGLSAMGCARMVYVQDDRGRPIEAAKVTLTIERDSSSVLTRRDGYARLPRSASEAPAKLVIEKEGYKTEQLNYPGNVSVIEDLEPLKPGG